MEGDFVDRFTQLLGISPAAQLDLEDIPVGPEFFLIVKNSFDRLNYGDVMEVRSTHTHIKADLNNWCLLRGYSFVVAKDAGDHYRYFLRKGSKCTLNQTECV